MLQIPHQELLELAGLSYESDLPELFYTHIETDSRKVTSKAVFFALPGVSSQGWDYLQQAAENGLKVAVVPKGLGLAVTGLTLLEVQDPKALMLACLERYCGALPAHLVAVTGTNGKSSICYYLAQLAQAVGMHSGLVGTFGIGQLDNLQEASQTTPDLLSMHKTLRVMAEEGVNFVSFEASSHALDQGRIDGLPFASAVFSNLTRDHLDYHGDMANYAEAKRKLFEFESVKRAVFCLDDNYAHFMSETTRAERIFYSQQNDQAQFFAKGLIFKPTGCEFSLLTPEGECKVFLPLLGLFNVQNALAALSALWDKVADKALLISALGQLQGAPGRMEKVEREGAPLVVVDYAHTPDALSVALQAVKSHCDGQLYCVYGCGGDRDRGKRPLMSQAALAGCDFPVLTSDNPRTESVQQILDDALVGVDVTAIKVIADRRHAIEQTIKMAGPNDVVLIAGKGHENYQDIEGVKHHFDDREEAQRVLNNYVG
ncbi:UDP-N-acetylmuramoyl-L-alanyl-D-glutamate--2,6-diaminopimelate ligase [Marinomonas epiphytica]